MPKDYFTSSEPRIQNFKVQWSFFQWSFITVVTTDSGKLMYEVEVS